MDFYVVDSYDNKVDEITSEKVELDPALFAEWNYKIGIKVENLAFDRKNTLITEKIDFTNLLLSMGKTAELDEGSIRLIRVDNENSIMGEKPIVFRKDSTYEVGVSETGEIFFYLDGLVENGEKRNFYLFFDIMEKGYSLPEKPEGFSLFTNADEMAIIDENLEKFNWTTPPVMLGGEYPHIIGNRAFKPGVESIIDDEAYLSSVSPFSYTIGDGENSIRYIEAWIYLTDFLSDMSFSFYWRRVVNRRDWLTHGLDAQPEYNSTVYGILYDTSVNIPFGQWAYVRLDLKDDVGFSDDEKIKGFRIGSSKDDALIDYLKMERAPLPVVTMGELEDNIYPFKDVQFTWNTSDNKAGGYKIVGEISLNNELEDENELIDSEFKDFNIIAESDAELYLLTNISPDKTEYNSNENIILKSKVESKSSNYSYNNLNVKILISNSLNNVVSSYEKEINSLSPLDAKEFNNHFNSRNIPIGTYFLKQTVNNENDQVLAQAENSFLIVSTESLKKGLFGNIDISPIEIVKGELLNAEYDISNIGNVDILNLKSYVKFIKVENSVETEQFILKEGSLEKSGIRNETGLILTENLDPGHYIATLTAQTDSQEQIVAQRGFILKDNESAIEEIDCQLLGLKGIGSIYNPAGTNEIYIAGYNDGKVLKGKLNDEGTVEDLEEINTGLDKLMGVIKLKDEETLYVSSYDSSSVHSIDLDNNLEVVWDLDDGLNLNRELFIAEDGSIYLSNEGDNNILVFKVDAVEIIELPKPRALAVSYLDNSVFAASGDGDLYKINGTSAVKHIHSEYELEGISSLSGGLILFSALNTNKIFMVEKSLDLVEMEKGLLTPHILMYYEIGKRLYYASKSKSLICSMKLEIDKDKDGYLSVDEGGQDFNDDDEFSYPDATEICDERDNDNDGDTDEDCICYPPYSMKDCGSDVGECVLGTMTCKEDGSWTVCENEVGPSDEICDGLDNNCNSEIDETCECTPPDSEKDCGTDVGECVKGKQVCENGVWSDCSGFIDPGADTCDGLDNNCDGNIDEDLGETFCGKGVCSHTVQNCVNGIEMTCNPFEGKNDEECDGLDNNCDGNVDEGCQCLNGNVKNCYGGPEGTADIGFCKTGSQECVSGVWTECVGDISPSTEHCDRLDNDCDGSVDEDLGETSCGQGSCTHTVSNCEDGVYITCDQFEGKKDEKCDGLDNDCDGETDENLGETSCGKGVCIHSVENCVNGVETICDPFEGQTDEECDGFDNNCDGEVDEGCECINGNIKDCYGGPEETVGKGLCENGSQECINGNWSDCVGDITPLTEQCDGLDNDCDGRVDEKCECVHGEIKDCYTQAGETENVGLCKSGKRKCVEGNFGPCEDEITPKIEECDGLDNDCDGETDEDVASEKYCGLGICRHSVKACENGVVLECNPFEGAQEEICSDFIDNDCNGRVDEKCECSGKNSIYCYTGPAETYNIGICKEGLQRCVDGLLEDKCDSEVLPTDEICGDNKDNNCNSSVDEGCPCDNEGASAGCGSNKGECVSGDQHCDNGIWSICYNQKSPAKEICDDVLDNDCDGLTDEMCYLAGRAAAGDGCSCSTVYINSNKARFLILMALLGLIMLFKHMRRKF